MLHVACGTSWRRECYGKYLTADNDADAGEEHELRLELGLGRRNCSQVISIELQCVQLNEMQNTHVNAFGISIKHSLRYIMVRRDKVNGTAITQVHVTSCCVLTFSGAIMS